MRQFLRQPDLFPARIAGESWGTTSCVLELCGLRFAVGGLSDSQRVSLGNRYGTRLHDQSPQVDSHVEVFRAPKSDFVEIDTAGWEYWLDISWSPDAVTMAGMNLMARADLAASRAGVWTSVDGTEEFWGVLENVLRPLIASLLLARGGLLVHSASVDGFLFAGSSGAGKSTIARLGLEAGLPVLSDDLNAVVPESGGFTLLPLPFTGDLQAHQISGERRRLRAVVGLEKGQTEVVHSMSLASAAALLVRSAPYVNQDFRQAELVLSRAGEIAAAVPRALLTFRREGDPWPILESLP